jgi:hypothetical protein
MNRKSTTAFLASLESEIRNTDPALLESIPARQPRPLRYLPSEVKAIKQIILPLNEIYPRALGMRVHQLIGANRRHHARVVRCLKLSIKYGMVRVLRGMAQVEDESLVSRDDIVCLTDDGVQSASTPEYHLDGQSDLTWLSKAERDQVLKDFYQWEHVLSKGFVSCLQ